MSTYSTYCLPGSNFLRIILRRRFSNRFPTTSASLSLSFFAWLPICTSSSAPLTGLQKHYLVLKTLPVCTAVPALLSILTFLWDTDHAESNISLHSGLFFCNLLQGKFDHHPYDFAHPFLWSFYPVFLHVSQILTVTIQTLRCMGHAITAPHGPAITPPYLFLGSNSTMSLSGCKTMALFKSPISSSLLFEIIRSFSNLNSILSC